MRKSQLRSVIPRSGRRGPTANVMNTQQYQAALAMEV